MRLFIGVDFPKPVVDELCSLQNKIRGLVRGGRFPAPNNLHLTLHFLGETPESRIAEIHQALSAVASRHAPFQLAVDDHIGYFGAMNPVRVAWVGMKGDLAALSAMQADVASAMRELGFAVEERAYKPHITLARDAFFLCGDVIRKNGGIDLPVTPFPWMRIEQFALISSEIAQGGRRYRMLATFRLAENR